MARIYKTPYLFRKCSLQGCERQAHFTIKDSKLNEVRVICDRCAFLIGLGRKRLQAWNELVEQGGAPDLGEILDGQELPPGDEPHDP